MRFGNPNNKPDMGTRDEAPENSAEELHNFGGHRPEYELRYV